MSEEFSNEPVNPPVPKRLAPYTPPARVPPPIIQSAPPEPGASSVSMPPAPHLPVPRPIQRSPARPAHRPLRESIAGHDANRSEPRSEAIETTRMTAPPRLSRDPRPEAAQTAPTQSAAIVPESRAANEHFNEGRDKPPQTHPEPTALGPVIPPIPRDDVESIPSTLATHATVRAPVARPPAIPPALPAHAPEAPPVKTPVAVAPTAALPVAAASPIISHPPPTRSVRVPAHQKRIQPAYPAARLIKATELPQRSASAGDPEKNAANDLHETLSTEATAATGGVDVVTSAAPSPAIVAPAAPHGELPWWIRALAGPALVRVKDRWLSTAERFAAEHWIAAVVQAVGTVLAQRLSWEWAGGSTDAEGQVFGVLLGMGPAAADEFMISLDAPLARAIVNRVTAQFAQLRGAGDSLSDADAGVLEFVALTTADRLADSMSADANSANAEKPLGAVFKQFLNAAEAVAWGSRSAVGGLAVQAIVGTQAGIARIWLPRSIAKSVLQQVKRTPPLSVGAESTIVSLQLPELAITEAEWNSLSPGDLLLIGVTQLTGASARWQLVTENGWSLCEAEGVMDTPTLIAAECSGLEVNVNPAAQAGAAGKRILRATVGRASLAIAQLATWKTGLRVELPKDAHYPVELWRGVERVGRGEIVDHDGEKAIHILEWSGAI